MIRKIFISYLLNSIEKFIKKIKTFLLSIINSKKYQIKKNLILKCELSFFMLTNWLMWSW